MTLLQERAARMRQYRQDNPEAAALTAARQYARARALRQLAANHPAEFDALYDVELFEAGLERGSPGRPPAE